MTTCYGLDSQGSIPGRGKRFFSTPHYPYWLWGLTSLLLNGFHKLSSPEVKRPVWEAEHSPPSSAEVKNGGAIPLLPHTSSWHRLGKSRACFDAVAPARNRTPTIQPIAHHYTD
jgi:hypothetical protein